MDKKRRENLKAFAKVKSRSFKAGVNGKQGAVCTKKARLKFA